MRVHLVHHADDRDFAATLGREMARRDFDVVPPEQAADVALVLASAAALRSGLGRAPRQALEAGLDVLTVLLGDDALPLRFPVARKHAPLANDVPAVMKHLAEYRRQLGAKQIDGKRELFGYGVLLALLHRP